jgi:hypothetical protein
MTPRRRKEGPPAEYWNPNPDELGEVGYREDGIVWLTVTEETATSELALAHFAGRDRAYRKWRVRGQWHLAVDRLASMHANSCMMMFTNASDPDGRAFWEIAAPDYEGPEGEFPQPE